MIFIGASFRNDRPTDNPTRATQTQRLCLHDDNETYESKLELELDLTVGDVKQRRPRLNYQQSDRKHKRSQEEEEEDTNRENRQILRVTGRNIKKNLGSHTCTKTLISQKLLCLH